jgi:hypothetical protein
MQYMVVETFRNGAAPVYERAREQGRMLPPGLKYVDSWVDGPLARCFQLMETDEPALIDEWTQVWDDLVQFEIIPVISSTEAAARVARTST